MKRGVVEQVKEEVIIQVPQCQIISCVNVYQDTQLLNVYCLYSFLRAALMIH